MQANSIIDKLKTVQKAHGDNVDVTFEFYNPTGPNFILEPSSNYKYEVKGFSGKITFTLNNVEDLKIKHPDNKEDS